MTNTRELTSDQSRVISWLATPPARREPKTVEELANEIGVRPTTISRWRARFLDPLVAEKARCELFEHLPEVYRALAERAKDGSPEHIDLFLKMAAGGFNVPRGPVTHN